MANIDFYSMYDRKMIKVPEEDVKEIKRGSRDMLMANIVTAKGKKGTVWKIKPKKTVVLKRKDHVKQRYHINK